MRICVSYAAWLGLLEVVRLLRGGAVFDGAGWVGLLAGVALSLPVALLAGLLLGAVLWLSAPAEGAPPWSARAWRWLWEREPGRQQARLAALLGALVPASFFITASFEAMRRSVIGVAQPHFAALAMLGAQLGLGLIALLLYPASRNVAAWCLVRPPLRASLTRAGTLLTVGLGVVVVALAVVAFWARVTLSFLPWPQISTVTGAAVLALGFRWLTRRAPGVRVAGTVCVLLLASFGAFAIASLSDDDPRGREALTLTLNGGVAYGATLLALDFDRDGALGLLGDGDCAAFDPRRGPNAVEIPNNGRDEDCDGADLDARGVSLELKRDFAVPKGFPRRPTILFITIDAFAADRMRALGNRRVVTPRLDALAAEGTLFRYAFSQGPSTRLSFPSIFTSRWDSQIKQRLVGKHPYPIDDSEQMLAEVLSADGYDSVAVISENYFRRSRWASLTSGFAEVVDSPLRTRGHNSVQVTDAALEVLRRPRTRPLFLWVHYFDAHPPGVQPSGIERFGESRADLYDAELKLVDREVGRLLDDEKARGGGDSLVIVTGDHGIAFDAPRHVKFNYGYDLTSVVLHVPLIVTGPQIKAQRFDHLVSTMDVAPTIANLLRIQQTLRFEGASLVPELLEGRASRPQRLVHQLFLEERLWSGADPLDMISLRNEHYNLIHNRSRGSYELYAWRSDREEAKNLASDPHYKPVLQALRQQLSLYTYRLHRDHVEQEAARGTKRRD